MKWNRFRINRSNHSTAEMNLKRPISPNLSSAKTNSYSWLRRSLLFKLKKVSMRSQNPLRDFCLTACWKAFMSCSWLPSTWPLLLLYLGYLQPGDESSSTLKPLRSFRAMSLLAVARPSIEATSADCDCTWGWIKALSRSRRRCATGSTRNWSDATYRW